MQYLQIYLGLNLWIDKEPWKEMFGNHPTGYLRDLASFIWGKELINKCFDLTKTTVEIPGFPRRSLMERDKMKLIQRK